MTKIFKFIHAMILFLSLFLVAESYFADILCKVHEDCPQKSTHKYYCIDDECFLYYWEAP
ncbi:putative Late nodulin [Medicago truncatula]|uniref:Nodule Cysteine-Rich (NCR) secreted peptide n=1 Tax=Medicago truncatula TaxID=3880 RepID=A0A072UYE1_MEDTR|nr:Nodule Cysteine-Rich (NCR) secreted peptide [Medicago truncatula]RHN68161.1 putative Late nodulin [Medicago truncatula]